MEIGIESYTIYIRPGVTDMRKGSRGLALVVQNAMELNPYDKAIFVFCSRNRRIMKAVVWDGNGWLEIAKRIESKERFFWPSSAEEARLIDLDMLAGTLKGYDMWRPFKATRPSYVG